MRLGILLAAAVLWMGAGYAHLGAAEGAVPRDTGDYPADPRPIVVEFFEHVRKGDAEGAWKCWNAEARPGSDKEYEQTQVRNTIAQWIADFRLEQALQAKLPKVYEARKTRGTLTPSAEALAQARFTTFRRLAIVRWSDDEDAALPLELDTRQKPPRWEISLSHYRETTRASVGDSFRTTNVTARVTEEVTKDVLAGKVRTEEGLDSAQLRHLTRELKKLPKPKE